MTLQAMSIRSGLSRPTIYQRARCYLKRKIKRNEEFDEKIYFIIKDSNNFIHSIENNKIIYKFKGEK